MYSIWHPYTAALSLPPVCVRKASGSLLELSCGTCLIDAIGSWWTSMFGHSYPPLVETLCAQANLLDHALFGSLTHEPAQQVAEEIIRQVGLCRVLFSDNGSTAVETGMKLACQAMQLKGQRQRTRFASFEGGYHGDTIGAMSLQGKGMFTEPYLALLKEGVQVPFVDTWIGDETIEEREEAALVSIEAMLEKQGDSLIAFVFEPLVQGSSGMRMCRPQFLQRVTSLMKEYGIFLIADEVMTGLGRTGSFLACQGACVDWDILALSKGLAGGMLPLAVTLLRPELFDVFVESNACLFHGHTFTANPIACAVAAKTLSLLRESSSLYKNFQVRYEVFCQQAEPLLKHVRVMGGIWAAELPVSYVYGSPESLALRKKFYDKGVLARPLGSTIYLLPAYTISEEELQKCFTAILEVAELVCG